MRAENKKLSKDFQALRQKFGEAVRATAARVREVDAGRGRPAAAIGGGAGRGAEDDDGSGLQFQLQQEAIDERILQEREEEIMKINQSVVKVSGPACLWSTGRCSIYCLTTSDGLEFRLTINHLPAWTGE